jgi:hypothetical protein
MLVSHLHRFIYIKTRKTGGTSVEIYFEPFCCDPNKPWTEQHQRDEEQTEFGIIGSRGFPTEGRTWFNHLPAAGIRAMLGPQIFDSYLKFCVVRDPFDKTVSGFWFWMHPDQRQTLRDAPFSQVREAFDHWVLHHPLPIDRIIYTVDGQPVANRHLRHERLTEDMQQLCADLQLPWEPERLRRYKSNSRLRNEPFADYYSPQSAARVAETFAWELAHFHYPKL